MSRLWGKAIAKRFALVFVSMCLTWMTAEIAAFVGLGLMSHRICGCSDFVRERSEIKLPTSTTESANAELGRVVHPFLGYVYDPIRPTLRGPGGPFPVNGFGFPGTEVSLQKRDPNRLIVGITGGSVARMFYLLGTDRLRKHIQQNLNDTGKEVVFVCFGVGGYKQPQQLMALNWLLSMGAEFDVVVNLDGFNEVTLYAIENAPQKLCLTYPRSWHLMAATIPDRVHQQLLSQLYLIRINRDEWAETFQGGLGRYSFLANLVWKARDSRFRTAESVCLTTIRDHGAEQLPFVATGPKNEITDETIQLRELVRIWHRCSALMHQTCKSSGIRYFHFLQPNQYLLDSKPLSLRERKTAVSKTAVYRKWAEMGYPLLKQEGGKLIEEGIPFFDLTMVFLSSAETVYIDDCCHFGATGNEILADAIWNSMRPSFESGILRAAERDVRMSR